VALLVLIGYVEEPMRTFARWLIVTMACCITATIDSYGLGFANPDQDARATAQGEAFVAQADAPCAVYYNPAGLTQLSGTQASSGGFLTFRDLQFHGVNSHADINEPAYTVHSYGVTDFGLQQWRFGFGVNIPFGNTEDWGRHTDFKYQITSSSLEVFDFQLVAAYKLNDHLSLGAGPNFYYSDTELRREVPFSLLFPGTKDGHFKFSGSGYSFGATAGLLWTLNPKNSIGLTYHSPFAIDYHGRANVKNDPTGTLGNSSATAQINFPQSVAAGYAFRPNPKLKLEFDAQWTDWDTLNAVKLHSPNPAFQADPSSTIPFNWMSSWFYEVGAQYTPTTNWTLRAGYIFSENTVPSRTFSPTLPDNTRHVFSAGVSYTTGRLTIDFTYQYSLTEDRTIKNSADSNFDGTGDLNGTWKSNANALMITSTFKF
jgi:long-chain fatty acid transport protein